MNKEENVATIDLERMVFYAYHGCFKEEQVVGNKFQVDITIRTDITAAMQSDSIKDALNYVNVYDAVKEEIYRTSHLLEHVTHRVVDRLLTDFPAILSVRAKVSKMNPPMGGQMKCVSMTLERKR